MKAINVDWDIGIDEAIDEITSLPLKETANFLKVDVKIYKALKIARDILKASNWTTEITY